MASNLEFSSLAFLLLELQACTTIPGYVETFNIKSSGKITMFISHECLMLTYILKFKNWFIPQLLSAEVRKKEKMVLTRKKWLYISVSDCSCLSLEGPCFQSGCKIRGQGGSRGKLWETLAVCDEAQPALPSGLGMGLGNLEQCFIMRVSPEASSIRKTQLVCL